jgi:hypothetical protein
MHCTSRTTLLVTITFQLHPARQALVLTCLNERPRLLFGSGRRAFSIAFNLRTVSMFLSTIKSCNYFWLTVRHLNFLLRYSQSQFTTDSNLDILLGSQNHVKIPARSKETRGASEAPVGTFVVIFASALTG